MSKHKNKQGHQSNDPGTAAAATPPGTANPIAFKLGFHHGIHKARVRKPESFIYESTANAYALGYRAGCEAREAKKGTA